MEGDEIMSAKLKTCPFCGSQARVLSVTGRNHYVICNHCESRVSEYRTPEEAIEAWNKRAISENNKNLCKILQDMCEFYNQKKISMNLSIVSADKAISIRESDFYKNAQQYLQEVQA